VPTALKLAELKPRAVAFCLSEYPGQIVAGAIGAKCGDFGHELLGAGAVVGVSIALTLGHFILGVVAAPTWELGEESPQWLLCLLAETGGPANRRMKGVDAPSWTILVFVYSLWRGWGWKRHPCPTPALTGSGNIVAERCLPKTANTTEQAGSLTRRLQATRQRVDPLVLRRGGSESPDPDPEEVGAHLPVGRDQLGNYCRAKFLGINRDTDGNAPRQLTGPGLSRPGCGSEGSELVGKGDVEAPAATKRRLFADAVVGREQDRRPGSNLGISMSGEQFRAVSPREDIATRHQAMVMIKPKSQTAELASALRVVGLKLFAPGLGVDEDPAPVFPGLCKGRA
jgi:hypothetical protein